MPVEIFTKEEFQEAMPPKATCLGLNKGELIWAIPMPHPKLRIVVRSSIHSQGQSAACGEDSIRLWLEGFDGKNWYTMGQKPDDYTNRVKGWQQRIKGKIRDVAKIACKVPKDLILQDGDKIFFVKKECPNKGRPFLQSQGKFVRFLA